VTQHQHHVQSHTVINFKIIIHFLNKIVFILLRPKTGCSHKVPDTETDTDTLSIVLSLYQRLLYLSFTEFLI